MRLLHAWFPIPIISATAAPDSITTLLILDSEVTLMEGTFRLILLLILLLQFGVIGEGSATEAVWVLRFGVWLTMVNAEFQLFSGRVASMVIELAAWFIPSTPAASPSLGPETLLASKLESARMMLALHLVVSVTLILLFATPVGTFHLHIVT